jgi:hypothetical protein
MFADAQRYPIADYVRLFSVRRGVPGTIQDRVLPVKKSLSEGKPVIIGMNLPESFFRAREVWRPTESPTRVHYGHAMCVVGYDDNKHGGAFEVLNSWGTGWGNDGFIWISYRDFAAFVDEAYEVIENLAMYRDSSRFGASIEIQVFNDTRGMPVVYDRQGFYRTRWSYPSGTDFRFLMTNHYPAFVYAFACDTGYSGPSRIFPLPGVSPVLDYSESTIAWPGEFNWIRLDDIVGTDYLVVLYAKEPLDIRAIEQRFANERGSFPERVARAVGPDFIPFNEVQYNANIMDFYAVTSSPRAVMGLLLAIEHHAAGLAPFEVIMPGPAESPSPVTTHRNRDFIKQIIEEEGRCRNVALTQRSGNVALFDGNGFAYQDVPAALAQTIDRMNAERSNIHDVHITEGGNWIIVGDTVTWAGIDSRLEAEIQRIMQRRESIRSVSFNDKGEWVLISDRAFISSNTEIQTWLRTNTNTHGVLRSVCLTDDGMIAVFERQIVSRGSVPQDLFDALRRTNLNVQVVKFSGNHWFFTDNNGGYQYYM